VVAEDEVLRKRGVVYRRDAEVAENSVSWLAGDDWKMGGTVWLSGQAVGRDVIHGLVARATLLTM